jgi:hypothetical protein
LPFRRQPSSGLKKLPTLSYNTVFIDLVFVAVSVQKLNDSAYGLRALLFFYGSRLSLSLQFTRDYLPPRRTGDFLLRNTDVSTGYGRLSLALTTLLTTLITLSLCLHRSFSNLPYSTSASPFARTADPVLAAAAPIFATVASTASIVFMTTIASAASIVFTPSIH